VGEVEPLDDWLKFVSVLNEAQKRWCAAVKALELGHGGITRVHELTGLSRPTIRKGILELRAHAPLPREDGIRRPGAGRKRIATSDPALLGHLQRVLDETTVGDPMSALKWTTKSTRTLAQDLTRQGHPVSARTVDRLIHALDFSLQGNRKVKEGVHSAERDRQFRYINAEVQAFHGSGDPVLSIDTKKKERVGEFKNPGETWRKKGMPRDVNVYDFPRLSLGPAIPYGVYDVQRNEGLVNVGISHDTAEFAVESIRQWWRRVGNRYYGGAKRVLLCADGGGSNGARCRAWKLHLQALADETGLAISVCHYPPGTSKWNKIEHRLFSFISLNWKGQPLVTYETVVNLIGGTTTRAGLRVKARLDARTYKTGAKVSDAELKTINLTPHDTYPKWNYTISPHA